MDKYEFNIKAEQISKLVEEGNYETAMQIADTIDWRRVRNANLLSSIADIYERNGEYEEAKDILMLAFQRAPVGKRFLYRLAEISLEAADIQGAQEFYNEFCDSSPEDDRQYLLRYKILRAKGAKAEQLAGALEMYTSTELDEKWLYELAVLYTEAGNQAAAVQVCDRIILMFGMGDYVNKAMALKQQYQPLTAAQQEILSRERAAAEAATETPAQPADELLVEETAAETFSELSAVLTEAPDQTGDNAVEPEIPAEAVVSGKEPAEVLLEEVTETALPVQKFDSYHMIIEAKSIEDGFRIAVDEIKYFHEKYGVSYKVAKTTAEKLNERGFAAFAEKIAGKDLIIENAGSLIYSVVDEISDYIEHPKDASSVVLVDTVDRFDRMAEDRPLFIRSFDLVSDVEKEEVIEDVDIEAEIPAAQATKQAPAAEAERPGVPLSVSAAESRENEALAEETAGAEEESTEGSESYNAEESMEEMPVPEKAAEAEGEMSNPAEEVLDVETFAGYAQAYARRIDCSMPGKAVMALYERIEMLKEDGIPLTRENAEQLIEDAADEAEKPSLGKKLTGMLHPKYDKEGKLILREENFID